MRCYAAAAEADRGLNPTGTPVASRLSLADPYAPKLDAGWRWNHSYVRPPGMFYQLTRPVAGYELQLRILNRALASSST